MQESPLNNIKIASPCSADWESMHGDDKKRFCGECKLNVYNLSGMSKTDAENLLIESEGRLCVRFYRRHDGTILTQDCPVGWAKIKKNVSRAATAVFSLIIGLFSGLFAFNYTKRTATHTMGDIAPVNSNLTIEDDSITGPPDKPGNYWMTGNMAMGTPVPVNEKMGEVYRVKTRPRSSR